MNESSKIDDLSKILLIGESAAIKKLRKIISRVSQTEIKVLVKGEPGTGRTHISEIIHYTGPRKDMPFVRLNGGEVSGSLAQSELFGNAKGAFTGAIEKRGRFEIADRGTLLIEDMEYASEVIQPLLISFLDKQQFSRVGETLLRRVDVRIMATAPYNIDKIAHIKPELFNLLISGIVIDVPPLRERKNDIKPLAKHFLEEINREIGAEVNKISDGALAALEKYDFPGNVRELKSIIKRACTFVGGQTIRREDLMLEDRITVPEELDVHTVKAQLRAATQEIDSLKRNSIPANPIWEGRWFPTEEKYCFVLMPFAETEDIQKVYNNHVKKVLESRCGLRCERADDIYTISGVMQSLWEGINKARLIIADLTGRNPNVFYELGIAHTLGKPVIMITQSMDNVPFDLRHLRCIVYSYKPEEIDTFEKKLEKTAKTVLSSFSLQKLEIK